MEIFRTHRAKKKNTLIRNIFWQVRPNLVVCFVDTYELDSDLSPGRCAPELFSFAHDRSQEKLRRSGVENGVRPSNSLHFTQTATYLKQVHNNYTVRIFIKLYLLNLYQILSFTHITSRC